jgi:hypothetical protein
MSASKQKGTSWESAIVQFLKDNGVPYAERRTLNGTKDRGDIAGIPGVVIEAKNEKRIDLASYANETATETRNDGAHIGAAWIKRPRHTSPGAGYVLIDGHTLIRLLTEAGYIPHPAQED